MAIEMDIFKNERKAASLVHRAEANLEKRKLSAAYADCQQAVKLAPEFDVAHNLLGYTQAELGDLDAAIVSFRTAIRLSPSYSEARENLRNARLEKERVTYMNIGKGDPDFVPGFDIEKHVYREGDLPGYYYLGPQSFAFQGFPGYRNLPGKSGYDPMDTYMEQGFMEGVILKQSLKHQLPLKNPIYWSFALLLGMVLVSPLLVFLLVFLQGNPSSAWAILLASLPYTFSGFLLLDNVLEAFPPGPERRKTQKRRAEE